MSITKDQILVFVDGFADRMHEHKQELTEYDQHIGDGDHGINMDRGMAAVEEKKPSFEDKSIADILKAVGMTLVSTVGGASGPLYGTAFMKAGAAAKGLDQLSNDDVTAIFDAMIGGIQTRGKAVQGEKTMLDALMPAREAFAKAAADGDNTAEALKKADQAAWNGVEFTKTIKATKGRASYLGERSIGFQDPGATSVSFMIDALTEAAGGAPGESDAGDTVGIVIVSHSPKIAQGVVDLALEMAPDARIAATGGLPDGNIGTDLAAIREAIDAVMSPAGVILLVDLGSAVMTSEMAIELSDNPELIKIMDAPLVEGALFAAVEASVGSDIKRISEVLARSKTEPKF
ncbi:MAG: dihydroxyacetone kinase subunit DhaL [Eubacteriaceae bacterium]|jgi:dihydroxyacetone kinase-like protein